MATTPEAEAPAVDDIWKACAYGDLEKLRDFVESDPQLVNRPDATGFLPLQWAALNNRVSVATLLLEKGAAVNATDNDKQTALHWAAVRGSLPCAELLLRSGARLEQVDCRGYGAIHVAAQYGHTGMIYHFKMRWDADVDTHDNDGRSPLHWAAYKGFPDTVKLLLFMDAHISRPDKEGCTPLHWASIRGKSEAAHILAQAGGTKLIAARDVEGQTAPQLATEKGHKSLGMFLANLQDKLSKGERFWHAKGMAVVCLGIILGLVAMFVHLVVMAPGMLQMNVTWAAWSWIVILTSGSGLVLMYRVSYNDPGFVRVTAGGSERELLKGVNGGTHHHHSSSGVINGGGVVGGAKMNGNVDGGGGGFNSNSHLNHPELWAGNWTQLCTTCKIVKPWGAKHCSVTNKCVHRFDHYCPWMGNCIGKKNHRDFVAFLILETIAMAVAFVVALGRLYQDGPTPPSMTTTGIIGFLVCDGSVLFPVLLLTCAQVSQVFRNITTNELANLHRYHFLRNADGRFHNPFDKGLAENVYTFACIVENEAEIQREHVLNQRDMGDILGNGNGNGNGIGGKDALDMV